MKDVVIMVLNYSHDVATAVLAVSGLSLLFIFLAVHRQEVAAARPAYAAMFRRVSRIGGHSLLYILIIGVPRVLFYREYEWAPAAQDLQVVAIIIKHIVMFALVGGGLCLWARLRRTLPPAGQTTRTNSKMKSKA